MFKKSLLVAFIFAFSALGTEYRWRDPMTGTHYLNLATKNSYREAYNTCRERGWDIFNFNYLNDKEKENFLASPELEALVWLKKFTGEPGERKEAFIWMSSQSNVVTVNPSAGSVSILKLSLYPEESLPVAETIWDGQESEAKNTLCMYQSRTWFGCSHEVVCVYEEGTGSYSIRYPIYEYGRTRAEALVRIRERAANWKQVGARCDLKVRDPYCISYR